MATLKVSSMTVESGARSGSTIGTVIEYISAFTPLSPGDVIATGTPGGVGDKRNPPLYMKAGDRVEVEIGAIGTLTNRIIDEQ